MRWADEETKTDLMSANPIEIITPANESPGLGEAGEREEILKSAIRVPYEFNGPDVWDP